MEKKNPLETPTNSKLTSQLLSYVFKFKFQIQILNPPVLTPSWWPTPWGSSGQKQCLTWESCIRPEWFSRSKQIKDIELIASYTTTIKTTKVSEWIKVERVQTLVTSAVNLFVSFKPQKQTRNSKYKVSLPYLWFYLCLLIIFFNFLFIQTGQSRWQPTRIPKKEIFPARFSYILRLLWLWFNIK